MSLATPRAPRRTRRRRRLAAHDLLRPLPAIVFALIVFAVWALYVDVSDVAPTTLPPPSAVFEALYDNRSLLATNAVVTIKEILLGYGTAIVVGLVLGSFIATVPVVRRAVYPWLVISQMVPIPAIAPIIVLWTGFDMRPKIIVIALVAFFPITVNTIDGLRSTDRELLNLMKVLGAGSWKRFRSAQIPAALPSVFTGLRISAALSVIGAVFAEWVGSSEGLGYLILQFNNQAETADTLATIATLSIIGICLVAIVNLVDRYVLRWYHFGRAAESDPQVRNDKPSEAI
jgi:ABC-type nitrate/sulfonate/bicarbonate transport system permease component